MRRFIALLLSLLLFTSGCNTAGNADKSSYHKYSYEFFGAFNTMIQFMGYAENEKQFEALSQKGQARFEELHKLYDIYNNYEGINNIKTINDNAGIRPVEVRQEVIDMLLLSKEWYAKSGGVFNIALGPVLSIWHAYREEGIKDPDNARVPDMELLKKAALKTDITKLEIDAAKRTVYLREPGMSLDVGAVAKGYATEIVARELSDAGFTSFIADSGGNIRVVGRPLDGVRSKWAIGIHDPNKNAKIPDSTPLDIAFFNDASLVSSGDYERFYEVDGKRYHHLIDPSTLMPGNYYRAVTIMTRDSGLADILSTVVYLLPYEKSRSFVESLEGVDAYWVMPDNSIRATENMRKSLKELGGATSK